MSKLGLWAVFALFLLAPAVFLGGQTDKILIAPEDSVMVVSVNVSNAMKSRITQDMIKLANANLTSSADEEETADIDSILQKEFNLSLKDLGRATFFALKIDPQGSASEFGLTFSLSMKDASPFVEMLKEKKSFESAEYNKVKYYKGESDSQPMYAFSRKEHICLSNSEEIIKKMIDVMNGGSSARNNKILQPFLKDYGADTVFVAGVATKDLLSGAEEPFKSLTGYGMGISIANDMKIRGRVLFLKADKAKAMKGIIDSSLAMLPMMAQKNEKAKDMFDSLLKPLKIVLKGNAVLIDALYTKAILDKAIEDFPDLMKTFEPQQEEPQVEEPDQGDDSTQDQDDNIPPDKETEPEFEGGR